jgi:hypothetical protein
MLQRVRNSRGSHMFLSALRFGSGGRAEIDAAETGRSRTKDRINANQTPFSVSLFWRNSTYERGICLLERGRDATHHPG